MNLGAFSISLSVKDLQVSRDFYESLGFTVFGGDMQYNYLMMKNGDAIIGIFQDMFDDNILTFNPGWDQDGKNLKEFQDVRQLHKHIKTQNIDTEQVNIENEEGPGSFVIKDPDGNIILIDQHRYD
jgi:catechol 2,3-dioxygenase-like lactoylglutathione lyase family enzyme